MIFPAYLKQVSYEPQFSMGSFSFLFSTTKWKWESKHITDLQAKIIWVWKCQSKGVVEGGELLSYLGELPKEVGCDEQCLSIWSYLGQVLLCWFVNIWDGWTEFAELHCNTFFQSQLLILQHKIGYILLPKIPDYSCVRLLLTQHSCEILWLSSCKMYNSEVGKNICKIHKIRWTFVSTQISIGCF